MAGLILFFLFTATKLVSFASVDEINSLNLDIFKDYNKNIRPPYHNDLTLKIRTIVFLMSVLDYDDVSGILRVIVGATLSWNDYRLCWNPLTYSNITEIVVHRDLLWFPDVIITNPAEDVTPLAAIDRVLVRINTKGEIVYTFVDKISVVCESDMTYFPFDTQTCDINPSPLIYHRKEVHLTKEGSKANIDFYTNSSVWDLLSTQVEESEYGIYGGLRMQITLKRRPIYFCINMLLPILILAIMNPLVFILPQESGERISFSVTIFLSFAVFMTVIGNHLPKSSFTIHRTSNFLVVVVSYSAAINMIAIINSWLFHEEASQRSTLEIKQKSSMHKEGNNGPASEFQRKEYHLKGCKSIADVVDRTTFCVSYIFLISVCAFFCISVI